MSLQGIFDPMVRAYFAKHGGGSKGEIVGYQYSVLLPDINTVWTDEMKKLLPYAFICKEGVWFYLYMTDRPIAMKNQSFYYTADTIGLMATLDKETNTWNGWFVDEPHNWQTADDIGEYAGFEGDLIDEDMKRVVWYSEDVSDDVYPDNWKLDFADPVTVYSDGTGVESGK
jgi:hypothetical protein